MLIFWYVGNDLWYGMHQINHDKVYIDLVYDILDDPHGFAREIS